MTVMSASMAAMMLPTAAPFFFAYRRDSRGPVAVAATAAVYLAVWAAIGAAAAFVMDRVMMPSSLVFASAAVAFAVAWTVSPIGRRARARCQKMCMPAPRSTATHGAFLDGLTYSASCVVCSAGVMVALVVLGMSNAWLIVTAAAVLLLYKMPSRRFREAQ